MNYEPGILIRHNTILWYNYNNIQYINKKPLYINIPSGYCVSKKYIDYITKYPKNTPLYILI